MACSKWSWYRRRFRSASRVMTIEIALRLQDEEEPATASPSTCSTSAVGIGSDLYFRMERWWRSRSERSVMNGSPRMPFGRASSAQCDADEAQHTPWNGLWACQAGMMEAGPGTCDN